MDYQMLAPPPALEPFVDCLWLLSSPANPEAPPEVVLPDGKTELIVNFGDTFTKSEGGTFKPQAHVVMSGQLTERILLKPTGTIGLVSARFKPAGAARFFALDYEAIVDRVITFADYEPKVAAALLTTIEACSTHEARLEALQQFLESRLIEELQDDVFVRQACEYIVQSEGGYSVQELVKLIGFSERQLVRKFKKNVGLPPKTLSRIMRFQKFLALTKTTPNLTLSDAALACDYYDQSHFIRDFTRFSGMSPQTYLTSSHPMSDHMVTPTKPPKA
jgi:AraC-like DNA-binding protein